MRLSERNITSFLKKHQIVLLSLTLALFSLHLALTDKKEVERGVIVKEVFSVTVTPMQRFILGAHNAAAGIWSGYISLVGIKAENDSLKSSILSLKEENNRLREDVNQNARLREILDYRDAQPFRTVAAGITAFNMDKWTRTVTINKGEAEGIKKDLAVISPTGVVGRIITVNNHTSTVLLNSDMRSNIDVLVQRTRVKGVIEGNGTDGLKLKYIRQFDDIQTGDLLLTSGLSGVFPKGLIVGEVLKIEKGNDNFFKRIEVRPRTDMQKLEEVLVVTDAGVSPEQ